MPLPTFDYKKVTVRSAAVLTNSYVAGTTIENAHTYNHIILLVDFTKGSLDSLEIKVEFSDDNSTFYQEADVSVSNGTGTASLKEYTFTATGKYRIPIEINDRYIKVSAKGTGTVTNSSCAISAILGVR